MSRLQGKTAVITGAARGIGRAIAVAYAREGAAIMGIDKAAEVSPTTAYPVATPADLAETQRLVEAEGGRFIPVTLDIRDLGALRAAAQRAQQELGSVDILVANAGIQVFAPLLDMDDAHWHDVIDTNLTGTANTEAYQDYRSDPPADLNTEQVAQVRGQRTAMRLPWLGPEDMAPIAVFLGSDEARHISGASFDVDAG
nr:hypothetical protein [Tanacetum cinerariifolium]